MITLTPADLLAEVTATRALIVTYAQSRATTTTPAQNLALFATELPLPAPISTVTKLVNVVTGSLKVGTTTYAVSVRWRYDAGYNSYNDAINHTYTFTTVELTTP